MRNLVLYICTLVLSACATTARPGLAVHAQDVHTLNTRQPCTSSPELLEAADLALVVIVREAARDGAIADYSAFAKFWRADKPMVCRVPLPEPCAMGGAAAGPCNLQLGRCARKAGCSSPYHAWAADVWPPVCEADWPDEPHCVKTAAEQRSSWERTLFHEIANTVVQRAGIYDPAYRTAAFQPGGLEARAWDAYTAARAANAR